jgi:hypothetical protein
VPEAVAADQISENPKTAPDHSLSARNCDTYLLKARTVEPEKQPF